MNIPPKYEDVVAQLETERARITDYIAQRAQTELQLDAALGREAVLREELALITAAFDELASCVGFSEARLDQTGDSPMDCANQLQQRLTVAEQRIIMLTEALEGMIEYFPEGHSDRVF